MQDAFAEREQRRCEFLGEMCGTYLGATARKCSVARDKGRRENCGLSS